MITTPMERLLKKHALLVWIQEHQESFDRLKAKLAFTPIPVFCNWNNELHVHVDSSSVALAVVLT